jgi:hypothetical protein
MINLHAYNLKDDLLLAAVKVYQAFSEDYPFRLGSGDGVVYQVGEDYLYAYRTKTGRIVVRGTKDD